MPNGGHYLYVINFKISGHSVVAMEALLALVSLGQKPDVLIFKPLKSEQGVLIGTDIVSILS